jgi:lipopolysaccharide export system permease protein
VKIIGRYVLKEHVGPFVFASTALTSLMLLQYIAKKFGELVGKGLPTAVITEFMLLSVPFTVAMTLPMAVLVAVLYAFSRLAAESEINALKASGVSMRTVLAPVLVGGLVMSLVMIAFNDQVLPRANHRLAVLQLDIFRTKPTFALRENVLNTVREGQLYLRAGHLDEGSSKMKDVVIYDLSDPLRRRTIVADSGDLSAARNQRDLTLVLFSGYMLEVPNNKPDELTRMFFRVNRKNVEGVMGSFQESQTGSVSKGDREMSVCEMQTRLSRADYEVRIAEYERAMLEHDANDTTKAKAPTPKPGMAAGIAGVYCRLLALLQVRKAQAQAPAPVQRGDSTKGAVAPVVGQPPVGLPDSMRRRLDSARRAVNQPRSFRTQDVMAGQRRQEVQFRIDQAKRDRNRYDVEIQKKFSLAAACVIFVLIGAPIALRFPRGGVGLVIGVSFAIFGLYYVGLIGGESLADKGYLPPWVAMWAANIILLVIGLGLASQMGRESTTSRGGDFAELLATTRARLLGWLRRFGVKVERRRK